ncbi:hypothetical protein PVAR5_4004 [Paecilomyces variotii No. 5]|uniref:Uncharacterized protein n=1 Tax=Byssochlamys spectabilis (strain No. 5 / NBRC 109023) TaxID=1356009 RepID=V5G3E2_BYSSN|nr:hypothetical protein PVAR5_4004 [Paecilomyces variotii No. 5]
MMREKLRKLLGDGGPWDRIKDGARRVFRCPVKPKPYRSPPSPPPAYRTLRPPRPRSLWSSDSIFEDASPVFSPDLTGELSDLQSEAKDTEIDLRLLDEMLSFPEPDGPLNPPLPELIATEEAKKELEAYHNGTHPAINGPFPWKDYQQFRDILTACITTGMTMCEIGKFLETTCHRKDKLLDGLVTVMVNAQDPYYAIGRNILSCFGPRDITNGPYYGDVDVGDEILKPAPPKTGAIEMPYFDSPFELKYRRETLFLRPWTFAHPAISDNVDNGVDGGGKVVADGLRLRRLPLQVPSTGTMTRSKSLNARQTMGVEEGTGSIDHPRRTLSLINPTIRPISQLTDNMTPANEPTAQYHYNERSAWSDDSSDDEATTVIHRSWSFRHSRALSWMSGCSMRSKTNSDIGPNLDGSAEKE